MLLLSLPSIYCLVNRSTMLSIEEESKKVKSIGALSYILSLAENIFQENREGTEDLKEENI